MSLSFRLLDCTFAKPCQYFISLQLDDHKKRLRTKVSDETAKPAFDQVFDLGDFEEDFAELTGATRRLTLDAFVVLGQRGRRRRTSLGTASVALPAAPASPGRRPRVEHHNLTFTRKETKTNGEIPVGRFRLEIAAGAAGAAAPPGAAAGAAAAAATPRLGADRAQVVVHARSAAFAGAAGLAGPVALRCRADGAAAAAAAPASRRRGPRRSPGPTAPPDGGDLERFDGAGAATKFQILAHLCTSLRDENAALRRADEDRAAAERKLGDAEARHAHLQRAHTAQSAFIQKLQADRAKVDAYKTTIAMQEQAELALKRDEPPVVAPDPATERKLAAALDEKRGLEFLVEAKDQRVKVLEDQLLGSLFESESEIHAAHSIIAAAKQAKRELDATRKAHGVAMKDIETMRAAIADDGYQVGALEAEVDLAAGEGLGAIADYSKLVVFMQRCDDGACLDRALNSTEAQLTALLSATATPHAEALEARVAKLVGEAARLAAALERSSRDYAALEERSDAEIYRLHGEVEKHESAEKRMKEREDKHNSERDRVDADKQLEDEVKEIQQHRSWECDVVTTHDELPARNGTYVIARLYDPPKGRGKLWWAVAEVLEVLEGDGAAPDSLLEVRLFTDYIKHVSNYAVNGAFDRDMSAAGLVTLRRDEIAYVDLKLSGAGDPSAGRDGPSSRKAGALLPPANATDEDKDEDKDPRGARKKIERPESDKDKEDKAKAMSRKKGTRISELEKRGVVARLKADEAAWERRDVHRKHETKAVEVGKPSTRRKTAESKKKRDLKKRKEKGEKISDEEQNATAFDEAEFNRTFFNATLEPWDADAGGLELVPGNASLVVVHRSALAYVDVDVSESRGNNRGRVPTYTLKSSMKSDTEDVLMASMGKWWHALAEEWKRSAACVPGAGAGDDDAGAPKKGPTDKYKAPKPPTYGDEYRAATNATNATAAANGTAPAPDAVAAAIAKEYLDRLRTRAEVLESVDARLEALEKKLAWVDDAKNRSVLSADEHAAQRAALLAGLAALEA
ncbi:hypothetical protein JL722_15085 [Aureococcus anophagefferens]|nr:hypothetical protein JL722_15085 [Aureococcus anophagefferens]